LELAGGRRNLGWCRDRGEECGRPPGGDLVAVARGSRSATWSPVTATQVKLPVGWHRLRIYADQPGTASRLRVVFGPAPDRSQPAPPATTRPPA
jgi:hypothetical protein